MLNFCPHCGQPWSHTKFCAHCGANLSKFIDDTPANNFTFATDSADTSVDIQGDFDIVLKELEDAAKRTSLEAFEVEESGDGKYTIVALKKKNASKLTVPDCVDIIAVGAFEGCKAYEITLPEGLLRIDERAFANSPYLENINIPSALRDIGNEAFAGCERLDITIPVNVHQGKDVMKNTLTAKREEEARRAAEETRRAAEEQRRAEEARKAFKAESVVVNGVLQNYKGNKTEVVIPDIIVAIDDSAFALNKTVQNITIPNSVEYIGECAFAGCSSLSSITIPNSVMSIGKYAFANCSNLSSITIPSRFKSILSLIGINASRTQITYI